MDVPIKALGLQSTFESALRVLKPGDKERMRRLMSVIEQDRLDLSPMVTHQFDMSIEACDLFSNQRDGVLKVATKA